jgi:hypothetical protein
LGDPLQDHLDYLAKGVVFDWAHPVVQGILRRKAMGSWYARSKSQGSVLIWKDGAPAPKPVGFKFVGTELLEFHTEFDAHGDGEVWSCYTARSDHPDWNEDTYWPEVTK